MSCNAAILAKPLHTAAKNTTLMF